MTHLENALRRAKELPDVSHLFEKPEEYTWDRVQRERAEGHPKYLGGNYKEWKPKAKYTMKIVGGELIYDRPKIQ